MTRDLIKLACLTAAALCAACAAENVVFLTATNVGVDITVDGATQGARVGYQRNEFVSMPVVACEEPAGDGADECTLLGEAYPVLAILEMSTGNLFSDRVTELRVRQTFATGAAAAKEGRSAEAVARAFIAAARGGDVLVGADCVASIQAIVAAAGDPPSSGALALVSRHLLGGAAFGDASLADYIRRRPGLDDADRESQIESIQGMTSRRNKLRRLLQMACQDGRGADVDALRAALAAEDGR